MRSATFGLAALAAIGGALPAAGQTPPPRASGPEVVVQGVRSKLSGWREAETSHVVLIGDGGEAELIRLSRNLERLHFLLSGLLGRADAPDDKIKLRITLIGAVPEFQAMDLRNRRWQQGPYSDLFDLARYYDPREDGVVMATTRVDQRTVIERTPATAERVLGVLSAQTLGSQNDPATNAAIQGAVIGDFATAGLAGPHDLPVTFGEHAIDVPAESLLYAGYAQHYLLTYFPAAYPRWYLDGFGQIFASLAFRGDTVMEYGRSPRGTSAVLQTFGSFPVKDVLDDSYLTRSPRKTGWTPIHAWLLTHFLFFSDTRRPQLRQYLAARARGDAAVDAARVFGDQAELARELRRYFGARKPYEQVTYPAARNETPLVHRLTEGEAAFVKGRLEMGARVLIPAAAPAGADPEQAKAIDKVRAAALRDRDQWLVRLRRDAAKWPGDAGAQLLLAEAECRSGHGAECLAAATRARTIAPQDARAWAWQGAAQVEEAVAAPVAERPARLVAARRTIAAANRLDVEAVEPLFAYHASYAEAGETPPVAAVDGLQKGMTVVPAAPHTRVALGAALIDRGQGDAARSVLLPVAAGAYDSPERPVARALLDRAGATGGGG